MVRALAGDSTMRRFFGHIHLTTHIVFCRAGRQPAPPVSKFTKRALTSWDMSSLSLARISHMDRIMPDKFQQTLGLGG